MKVMWTYEDNYGIGFLRKDRYPWKADYLIIKTQGTGIDSYVNL